MLTEVQSTTTPWSIWRLLGYLALTLGVFASVFVGTCIFLGWEFNSSPRPTSSRVQADLRTMQTGLKTYWIDTEAYPPELWRLTTPIAYLERLAVDHYSLNSTELFQYHTDGKGYILVSRGPDRVYQIQPERDFHYAENRETIAPALLDKMYDPSNGMDSWGDIFRIGP